MLDFSYRVIQLNRLNWRDFLRQPNPVAAALMSKMRIAPEDRPRVKWECLRMMVTLRLDPGRQMLIRTFMDAYLRLSVDEMRVYDKKIESVDPTEREAVMQIINEWEARGEARGERLGKADLLLRQLRARFERLPIKLEQSIGELTVAQLDALGEIHYQLPGLDDIARWLNEHG